MNMMTLDLPKVKKNKQNSSTVSISTDEVLSHNKAVDSAYWAVSRNSKSSSSSASIVSSRSATTNFGLFERGKLRFSRNIERKTLASTSLQPVIASDASLREWGAFSNREKTRGIWKALKKKDHINVFELKAAK